MDYIQILLKALLGGTAAVGFGVLFNVPVRTLIHIFILGLLGVTIRNVLTELDFSIILASLTGASTIGILSLLAAKDKHAPPLVFSIPAVIPMVPGIFTYKLMLGVIRLTSASGDKFNDIFASTVNNGLKATFILMALAVGVSVPNLIFRRESFHELRLKHKA